MPFTDANSDAIEAPSQPGQGAEGDIVLDPTTLAAQLLPAGSGVAAAVACLANRPTRIQVLTSAFATAMPRQSMMRDSGNYHVNSVFPYGNL